MELKYISYNKSKHKNDIKKMYINSFMKAERFPFWLLKYCSKEKNVIFNEISNNEGTVGMNYIIDCSDFAYLMYFAIDENQREKGYGSKVLEDLIKKHKNVMLCIERPDMNFCGDKERRKKFYIRNGFYETNKFIYDSGVEYELLCTNKELLITEEKLQERYIKMTTSPLIRILIGKIFNINNIKFVK